MNTVTPQKNHHSTKNRTYGLIGTLLLSCIIPFEATHASLINGLDVNASRFTTSTGSVMLPIADYTFAANTLVQGNDNVANAVSVNTVGVTAKFNQLGIMDFVIKADAPAQMVKTEYSVTAIITNMTNRAWTEVYFDLGWGTGKSTDVVGGEHIDSNDQDGLDFDQEDRNTNPAGVLNGGIFTDINILDIGALNERGNLIGIPDNLLFSNGVLAAGATNTFIFNIDIPSFLNANIPDAYKNEGALQYSFTLGIIPTAAPIPSAVILFTTGLLGLIGFARRKH